MTALNVAMLIPLSILFALLIRSCFEPSPEGIGYTLVANALATTATEKKR